MHRVTQSWMCSDLFQVTMFSRFPDPFEHNELYYRSRVILACCRERIGRFSLT